MSQGDTQSQYFGPPQVSASKSTCSPSKLNATVSPVAKSQICLIPSKASEIARDAQHLRRHARELAKSEGKKTKKGHIVLCQCGLKEEGGDMVSETERTQERLALTVDIGAMRNLSHMAASTMLWIHRRRRPASLR